MKSVLISIRPEWVEKIVNGEKIIEVRKTAPKELPFKAYIYATRPKKFYKCGAVCTSDELLWLSNCKVEMGDGFKFWADGDEYQCLNGRIIGEFICNEVEDFYCASVPYSKENNLGYGQFVDNGVYKVNGWHEGIVFERNDRYIETMLNNDDLKEMCLSAQELFDYIGVGKHLYTWHISNLKIYDKPKELSEFQAYNFKSMNGTNVCGNYDCKYYQDSGSYMIPPSCAKNGCRITCPPQSWQYVEELEK